MTMKLDLECVRDVLLTVEDCPFGERLTLEKLAAKLPDYSEEALWYTCLKLEEGELLALDTALICKQPMPSIQRINNLTYTGHEFLANIRKDNIWAGVKAVGEKLGTSSLTALTQIASAVATSIIKSYFGLT